MTGSENKDESCDHELLSETGDSSVSAPDASVSGILVIPSQEKSLSYEDYHEIVTEKRTKRESSLRRRRGIELDDLSPRFGDITIRDYPITLGDNPGGKTVGPSLTIEWEPCSSRTVKLSAYEKERRKELRRKDQLIIDPKQRQKLLRRCGFSTEEILQAKADVQIARKRREESSLKQLFGKEKQTISEFGETLSNFFQKARRTQAHQATQQQIPKR